MTKYEHKQEIQYKENDAIQQQKLNPNIPAGTATKSDNGAWL